MSKIFLFLWERKQGLVFLVLVLLSLAALSLPGNRRFVMARKINRALLTPFQMALAQADYFVRLRKENETLRKGNFLLSLELYRLEEVKKQNERLETLLNFIRPTPIKFIACRVVSYGIGEQSNTFILDKGSSQGISTNLPVLVPEGLVGKTIEVDPSKSLVQLYSHPEFRVSAKPSDKDQRGIVGGTAGNKMYLYNIPLRSQVEVGDLIVSSGMGGIFPKGIPVGTVTELQEEEMGIKMRALLEPVVDLDKVSEVFVLVDTEFVSPGGNIIFESADSLSQLWSKP